MRRLLIAFTLALVASALSHGTASAEPPRPPGWDQYILCAEGYHAMTHRHFTTWANGPQCLPDRP